MRIRKLANFIYTYSMAIRFIVLGSYLFLAEAITMSGNDKSELWKYVSPIDCSLMIVFSLFSFIDFFVNNRKKEVSYWCLLLAANLFFISSFFRYLDYRAISFASVALALLGCLISFVFTRTVRNRKDFNFLAVTYLIFIGAAFLSFKPWLLFRH